MQPSPLKYFLAKSGPSSHLLRRPSLSLESLYSNAVALAQDKFSTESQEVLEETISPLALTFANSYNYPHFLIAADEEGVVHCRNTRIDSSTRGHIAAYKVHRNAIFALKFLPQDESLRCVSASGDRNLILLDCQRGAQLGSFEGHLRSVKCLDFQKDSSHNVFASGGRDGHVMLWDIRSGIRNGSHYPVGYLVNAHRDPKPRQRLPHRRAFRHAPYQASVNIKKVEQIYGEYSRINQQSITDILFQTDNIFITAGTADSTLRFWDLRKLSQDKPSSYFSIQFDSPAAASSFTSICMDSTRTNLFASNMDKTIYKYDIGPQMHGQPAAQYVGASLLNFYMKCSISADDEWLGCGSCDNKGYLFKVKEPETPPIQLVGHMKEEVLSIAFNYMDPYQMATHGDDDQVLIWHTEPYIDRSHPPDIIGKAVVDSRGLAERTPKRRSRDRIPPTVDRNTPSVLTWVRKRPTEENNETFLSQSPPSPPVTPRPTSSSVPILRTPNRDESQKKKRLKTVTLSPFFRPKPRPRSPSATQ